VGRGHAYLYTATSSGNCGWLLSVLRDTPHARVSVSYVLEASLLNDRVQRESGGNLEANLHARFLARKYSTEGLDSSQCYFCNHAFLLGKHYTWMQAVCVGVVATNGDQFVVAVAHSHVLSVTPIRFSHPHLSSVIGPTYVFGG